MTFNRFKSKADGLRAAKKFHACLSCRYSVREHWGKVCPSCGEKNTRQLFHSKTELQRGMLLLTLRDRGKILDLVFQPRFDLLVNGIKVCTYTADCQYRYSDNDKTLIVEDTKAIGTDYIEPTSKLKIALFEAIYGFKIRIPQREVNA